MLENSTFIAAETHDAFCNGSSIHWECAVLLVSRKSSVSIKGPYLLCFEHTKDACYIPSPSICAKVSVKEQGRGLCGQDRRHRNISESRTDAGGRNVGDLERAGTVFPHATAKKSCDFLKIGEKPRDLRHHLKSILIFPPFPSSLVSLLHTVSYLIWKSDRASS